MYKWNLIKNAFLMMITQAFYCSLSLILYFFIDDVASGKYTGDERLKRYGMWYGLAVLTQLGGSVLQNYIFCDLARTGIRLKNTVIFALYKKILKTSVLNPSQHTEGNIINYVQVAYSLTLDRLPEDRRRHFEVRPDHGGRLVDHLWLCPLCLPYPLPRDCLDSRFLLVHSGDNLLLQVHH